MTILLDDFPSELCSSLPHFNSLGNLPPGDYAPNRDDFEKRLVHFGNEQVRGKIYEGWNRHRAALLRARLVASTRQLLNGSFSTAKSSPEDIDIAIEVPVENLDQIDGHPARFLLRGPEMKPGYSCDAYPIWCLSKQHELYETVTVQAIRYWTKWFGTDRSGNAKGRVWATTGGLR